MIQEIVDEVKPGYRVEYIKKEVMPQDFEDTKDQLEHEIIQLNQNLRIAVENKKMKSQ